MLPFNGHPIHLFRVHSALLGGTISFFFCNRFQRSLTHTHTHASIGNGISRLVYCILMVFMTFFFSRFP